MNETTHLKLKKGTHTHIHIHTHTHTHTRTLTHKHTHTHTHNHTHSHTSSSSSKSLPRAPRTSPRLRRRGARGPTRACRPEVTILKWPHIQFICKNAASRHVVYGWKEVQPITSRTMDHLSSAGTRSEWMNSKKSSVHEAQRSRSSAHACQG